MKTVPSSKSSDTTAIADWLGGLGMAGSAGKGRRFIRAVEAVGGAPSHLYHIPGRIEVFGKHTDYCGGRSLVCAVEQGLCLAVRPRFDDQLCVRALDLDASVQVALKQPPCESAGGWALYPHAVARRLVSNFGPLRGLDVAFTSDLPRAAGMSSSSALIIGLALALLDRNDLHPPALASRAELAHYLGCVESGAAFVSPAGLLEGETGVGTSGGSQDHAAILMARPGHLTQVRFCPIRHERDIPLPPGWTFVIASSGVVAEKTGAARDRYNALSHSVRKALDHWNTATDRQDPTLAAALAADEEGKLESLLPESLRPRVAQFRQESERLIPAAAEALAAGDLARFGELADASQQSAESGLGNQVPETICLHRSARELGAAAASAFGAGFGGSVWALVPAESAEAFRQAWAQRYAGAYPQAGAEFLVSRPAASAGVLAVEGDSLLCRDSAS